MPILPAFFVNATPQDIVAALSLSTNVVRSFHKMQNIGTAPIIYSQRLAAPADLQTLIADQGHILAPAGVSESPVDAESTATFDAAQGAMYVWTAGAGSNLVVSDGIR